MICLKKSGNFKIGASVIEVFKSRMLAVHQSSTQKNIFNSLVTAKAIGQNYL